MNGTDVRDEVIEFVHPAGFYFRFSLPPDNFEWHMQVFDLAGKEIFNDWDYVEGAPTEMLASFRYRIVSDLSEQIKSHPLVSGKKDPRLILRVCSKFSVLENGRFCVKN